MALRHLSVSTAFFSKNQLFGLFYQPTASRGLQVLKSHSCWVSGRQQQLCLGTNRSLRYPSFRQSWLS